MHNKDRLNKENFVQDLTTRIIVIPHEKQRYNTVGDYEVMPDGTFEIRVSKMPHPAMEQAIAMHELTEYMLCREAGVTIAMIDKFDLWFEKTQDPDNMKEPGNDPRAPYFRQHKVATAVEEAIIAGAGLDWNEYDGLIMNMMAERARRESVQTVAQED